MKLNQIKKNNTLIVKYRDSFDDDLANNTLWATFWALGGLILLFGLFSVVVPAALMGGGFFLATSIILLYKLRSTKFLVDIASRTITFKGDVFNLNDENSIIINRNFQLLDRTLTYSPSKGFQDVYPSIDYLDSHNIRSIDMKSIWEVSLGLDTDEIKLFKSLSEQFKDIYKMTESIAEQLHILHIDRTGITSKTRNSNNLDELLVNKIRADEVELNYPESKNYESNLSKIFAIHRLNNDLLAVFQTKNVRYSLLGITLTLFSIPWIIPSVNYIYHTKNKIDLGTYLMFFVLAIGLTLLIFGGKYIYYGFGHYQLLFKSTALEIQYTSFGLTLTKDRFEFSTMEDLIVIKEAFIYSVEFVSDKKRMIIPGIYHLDEAQLIYDAIILWIKQF